jgi:phosphatidylinositol alpha-1,6-mannosyltransferase
LLQAMPQVLAGHPEAVLVIVGKGDYADHLKRLAWRLGLTDAVIFTGGVPQAILPSFYAAASVFAGPSRSRYGGLEVEGFGIVYLEAQASGLPVVVGRSGGSPEALQDGRTGLLVDGTDPTVVASAINQLLTDPIKAKAMGQTGRAWVQSKWTWESRAALLQELLAV